MISPPSPILDESDENSTFLKLAYKTRTFEFGATLQDHNHAPNTVAPKKKPEFFSDKRVKKIRNLKKPVVCAVNGVAAGAGANIALACDVVFAAKSSSFIQAFSNFLTFFSACINRIAIIGFSILRNGT